MLIVCAGPDSFQAVRKAQDLERAFREKYDPTGLAVDRLTDQSLEIIATSQSGGLFSRKRFLRCTELISSWKKADWEKAPQVFARNQEDVIVVTVEEELSEKDAERIQTWPKSLVYRFPALVGPAFMRFAEELAKQQQIPWAQELQQFAGRIEGDSWTFWNALPRWKATGSLPNMTDEETSPFVLAERYLREERGATIFRGMDEPMQGLFLQQARQVLRLLGGEPDARMPAFAQRKWQRLSERDKQRLLERYGALLTSLVTTRRGLATEDEEALLLSQS